MGEEATDSGQKKKFDARRIIAREIPRTRMNEWLIGNRFYMTIRSLDYRRPSHGRVYVTPIVSALTRTDAAKQKSINRRNYAINQPFI